MSVTEAIRDHLLDNSDVTNIVGEAVRESWAHHDQLPYVTIDGPHTSPEHHQTAELGRVESLLQIDCWEKRSRGHVARLSIAVRKALYRKTAAAMGGDALSVGPMMCVDGPRAMDQESTDGSKGGIFRDFMEFSVWHEQEVSTPS